MKVRRVTLAGDQPRLLRGLADVIASLREFVVVGMASSAHQALSALARLKPDIAILDAGMPDLDGAAVQRTIREHDLAIRLILLIPTGTQAPVPGLDRFAAAGLLPLRPAGEALVECLRAVAEGKRWPAPEPRTPVFPARSGSGTFARPPLTAREREISLLVRRGLSNRAIAAAIGTTEGTVKVHLHTIFRKLKISNRAGLAALPADDDEQG